MFSFTYTKFYFRMSLELLIKDVYHIYEALITAVNKHADSQSYTVVKSSSKRYKDDLIHKISL